MRALRRITHALPRATALRPIATRTLTINPPCPANQPASDRTHHHVFPFPDTRPLYTTQIYHGQSSPSSRRALHTSNHIASPTPNIAPGPATGLGTGVSISAQMFGAEVKGNPTESEADVAADRSDLDPLAPELHHTIRMGAGEAAARPTESEEDVVADRGGWPEGMDPVWGKKGGR